MNTNPFRWLINLLAEMNPFLRWGIFLAEILILVTLLLPESLFQSFSCETPPGSGRLSYQSTNGRFIDNQMIVIGTVEDINLLVTQPPPEEGEIALVEDCDLSYLNTRRAPDSNIKVEERELVMRLYEFRPVDPDVVVNVEAITGGIVESAPDRVFADPNYLTR